MSLISSGKSLCSTGRTGGEQPACRKWMTMRTIAKPRHDGKWQAAKFIKASQLHAVSISTHSKRGNPRSGTGLYERS